MPTLTPKALKKLSSVLRATAMAQLGKALRVKFPKAEVFLVGGYVRDLMLNRETKDIDLVVRGVPGKKLENFLRRAGRVNLVGRSFGVYKFIPKHKAVPAIDIALPRTEIAFGTGGYRDVKVRADARLPIEDDLSRRDFTINAMAWNILSRRLIDPWNGVKDIRKKTIRAVGKPEARFKEDYSRMLRAIRLACQLNFDIEPKTWQALKKLGRHINDKRKGEFVVPRETVAKEILKSFTSNPVRALELLDKSGFLQLLIPELLKMKGCPQPKNYHSEGDVWQHTRLALEKLQSKEYSREFDSPANAETIMAVLFHDIAKPKTIVMPKKPGERIRFNEHAELGASITRKIAKRLRLSNYKDELIDIDNDRLAWLVGHHLLLISGDPMKLRATTIERYYLRNRELGNTFLAMQFADGAATLNAKKEPMLREYRLIKSRIKKMLAGKKTKKLPAPLLDGFEIMKATGQKPGPKIGEILTTLREAQLSGKIKTKKQALAFTKAIK